MPSLSVAFGSDTANPNQRIFPQETEFTTTWDLSVQLAWSLDGALLEGARRQRERALAEAERLGRDETRDALRRDVLQARGDLAAALLAVEARHAAAHSAARAAEDADARADAGVSTAVDRAAAAAEALSARLDLVDALVDAQLAHARLRRVLGLPLTPPGSP